MMMNSLPALFRAISQTHDEEDLRRHIMVKIGEYFAAKRWGLVFFDQLPSIEAMTPSIIKLALSLEHNPVLRYLVEHHAPVHDQVLPPGVWRTVCPRSDHGHVMMGPIVSNNQLVGGIGFTRELNDSAFNAQDLADLSALCLHLSIRLATLRAQPTTLNSLNVERLTPREIQIAELVAQGLTNAQIGTALWITENSVKQALKRIFRKLNISSRTELATKLSLSKDKAVS
jgi:DNA-binding CsgD family transcriptional regulator